MEQKTTPNPQPAQDARTVNKPNEHSSLNIDDFVRIYDPNSDKVFLEKRS